MVHPLHCTGYFNYTQYMTLHETTENVKKGGIATGIGLGVIITIVMIFKMSVMVFNILFPPNIAPPSMAYGKLPPLAFPPNAVEGNFVYKINTATGDLPNDFPDRLNVFPIIKDNAGLLNLKAVESKVAILRFVDDQNKLLPGIPLGNGNYQWEDPTGIKRKIIFDIVTFNFALTSNYLTSNTARRGRTLSTQDAAIQTVQAYLTSIDLVPNDLDIEKTKHPDPELSYLTAPRLYAIAQDGSLTTASSLLLARVIRVDLYQKNVTYELNTGVSNDKKELQKLNIDMPVLYPKPPFSTMNFLIAAGESDAEIVDAHFLHQKINYAPDTEGTYPIKSPQEAFEEVKAKKAYIANYNTPEDNQILITKVYLAYYLGEEPQEYLMPIIVFEGQNGFYAYVSAVKELVPTEEPATQ